MSTITTSGTWPTITMDPSAGRVTGLNTNYIKWGGSSGSGYEFNGHPVEAKLDGTEFVLGTFTHHNQPTNIPQEKFDVDLDVKVEFEGNPPANLHFTFNHFETPNTTGSSPVDDDLVDLPSFVSAESVRVNGAAYKVELSGFKRADGSIVTQFRSPEGGSNSADIVARFRLTLLKVWQQNAIERKSGSDETAYMNVAVESASTAHVDTDPLTHTFKAPAGYVWSGYAAYATYGASGTVTGSSGALQAHISDGGKTLTFINALSVDNLELDPNGKRMMYTLGLTPEKNAQVGRHDDGKVTIESDVSTDTAKLIGTIIDAGAEDTDPVTIEVPATSPSGTQQVIVRQDGSFEGRPGGESVYMNVIVESATAQTIKTGGLKHTLTAPSGFEWDGYAAYAYYGSGNAVSGAAGAFQVQISADKKTLTFDHDFKVGNPAKDPKGKRLVYTLGLKPQQNASVGRHVDGSITIGAGTTAAKLKGTIATP
ncbi:choice-of-anchor K domain-containing protein [Streptomyces sp. NPDC057555]|uniref:choice-of-anchor K domain-containing protein n=1 Tax=Streptomyces sp. NPDC057555 TaxID=3346166 RepID=UPI00368C8673